ncbi:GNAT family N-acetyltransferase [Mesorhizobium retamae]|uniref:GNAT family N-acetyltransferase n=1 Tax=Mesorhizobium retamae TaxID=2912854 RepID=A0ABS9QCA1_9HYPH|nr:GNAT family N-acetyltransferase [Mesorhizobium sp. IRAMC:0171]MCG7504441.1 GNAT family N-acetyltransferase [Mesorhizobium sp. IRAMC:0171]
MRLTLRSLGEAERKAVIALHVADDQDDFVATNAESLEEADENPACVPLGIFVDDEPVGFAMYTLDADDGNWWIYRLMIDQRFQKRGYGRAALRAVVERMSAIPGCNAIYLGVMQENRTAAGFYHREGFRETGQILGDETVMRLELGNT